MIVNNFVGKSVLLDYYKKVITYKVKLKCYHITSKNSVYFVYVNGVSPTLLKKYKGNCKIVSNFDVLLNSLGFVSKFLEANKESCSLDFYLLSYLYFQSLKEFPRSLVPILSISFFLGFLRLQKNILYSFKYSTLKQNGLVLKSLLLLLFFMKKKLNFLVWWSFYIVCIQHIFKLKLINSEHQAEKSFIHIKATPQKKNFHQRVIKRRGLSFLYSEQDFFLSRNRKKKEIV